MIQYLEESLATAAKLKKRYREVEQEILQLLFAIMFSVRSGKTERSTGFLGIKQLVAERLEHLKAESISWCHIDLASIFIRGVVQCDLDTLDHASDNELADEYNEAVGIIVAGAEERLNAVNDTVQRNVNDVLAVITLTLLSARLVRPTIGGQVVPPLAYQRIENLQKDLMERGLTGFVDRRGAQWNMQSYVEVVLDNNIIQAYRKGYTMRMIENGFDLVEVVGGINENSCEPCIDIVTNHPVLSVTGATPGFMTIEEAETQGLGHMNCVHYYQYCSPERAMQLTTNPNVG
jgi:hypothetical protein